MSDETEQERPKVGDLWFRIEDYKTAPSADENGDPVGRGERAAKLRTFVVIKVTPRGVWLGTSASRTVAVSRFVLVAATRRFAAPSVREAFKDYSARKHRERGILVRRLNDCDDMLFHANKHLDRWEAAPPSPGHFRVY